MDTILLLLLGLLGVLALPGLLLIWADHIGPTETHHRTRDNSADQPADHPAEYLGAGW